MRKPRILMISDVKNWGGYERATYIKEYLSDEFEFDIMDGDEFKTFERDSDQMFIKWDTLNNYRLKRNKWTKQWICLPEIIEMKKQQIKAKRDYDLYYLMFHTFLTWWEVKRMIYSGAKFISVVTGLPVVKEVFDNEKYIGNKLQAFQALTGATVAVFANNMISLNELKKVYGGATFYTPRGVDPEVFYKHENTMTVDNIRDNMATVFVGKARSGKGLERFIRPACEGVKGKVKLHINEKNYTDALTKPQMRELYNKAHVYMVASETDGTPNPALEAAACGRPIISNKIGNMPEFIEDGYNGFIVDRNVGAYMEKLQYFKENPEECIRMGNNARKTVLESWTWEHVTQWERIALREIFGMNK
jgi:glycosyltransferase involved in cell wall biosynthesis